MKTENNIISTWLSENGDPEIEKFVEKNLEIVDRVYFHLKEKDLSLNDLAKLMKIEYSELHSWLTGLHELTLKNVIKLEIALGENLIKII